MTVNEIMERVGLNRTGLAIAYIKDALTEMNLLSETHTKTVRIDINENQRFYDLPNEMVKILDIRCKHQDNENEKYRSIPRMIHEPTIKDEDGE
tara:strand:+ start:137 stop:418 length:282 start_codon:yes stop_codon:yes gene_type:complete